VGCVSGFTALDLAISFGHEEIVVEIVQYYPASVINELLVSRHIDSRLTSYDLAKAVGNSAIIETLGSRMRSHRP
jgi:ankyrin repeat protein